jgi:gamma-glutamyltranspeptidase / glutathione hydrolase
MNAGKFLRRFRASTGLLIAGFAWLTSFHSTMGHAQALTASPCNSGASNPPACSAVARGDRAEGWIPQGRSEVMARNGLVTTSQPLAAQAGLRILREGGNAVDAAIAVASTLNLVEPMNTGLAGDVFAMVWIAKDKKLYVLNASGEAPTGATLAHMNSLGYLGDPSNWGPGSGMPPAGITTVTVPGALWGWDALLRRFGNLPFEAVLKPAIEYAEQGFPISERIAHDWQLPNAEGPNSSAAAGCCTQLDPDSINTWYVGGKPPVAGQIFTNKDLAKTFRLIASQGRDVFYNGEIARAIVAKSTALGGTMTLADLANYSGEWVTPTTVNYHGFQVYELPPPSQGWATNEMLNILQECVPALGYSLATLGPNSPEFWHLEVEAKKLAYADLYTYNGDPNFNPKLLNLVNGKLLTTAYAKSLCGKINPHMAAASAPGSASGGGDTTVASVADRWGNMVSWVNSNYAGFGSGITVPGYGFVLHNRGGLFSLNKFSPPSSSTPNPNLIEPHKRPYNTLMAGVGMGTNGSILTLGLMGGDMQAQGHAQMIVNMVDLGANLQASTDMARFYHNQVPNVLELESQLFNEVGSQLKAMGHDVVTTNGAAVGGYQAILFTPDPDAPGTSVDPQSPDAQKPIAGFYRAGSDHRKDGEAVGW